MGPNSLWAGPGNGNWDGALVVAAESYRLYGGGSQLVDALACAFEPEFLIWGSCTRELAIAEVEYLNAARLTLGIQVAEVWTRRTVPTGTEHGPKSHYYLYGTSQD